MTSKNTPKIKNTKPKDKNKLKYIVSALILLALWWFFYSYIQRTAHWVTYNFFKIAPDSKLGGAVDFFLYDTVKIFLLLVLVIYVLAWVRASISVERVRDFLMGKNRFLGYFLGSGFGAITPFCSCSSIPLFLGFTTARIPLGITMAFLITSPLINEIAIIMLWSLLGWKFTIAYVLIGMFAGIFGGAFMDLMKAERWLQPFILEKIAADENQVTLNGNMQKAVKVKMTWQNRHQFAWTETSDIFKRIWIWVIIGVGVGAAIHGYVPENFISDKLGDGQWWSVPLAVLIGIPLYTNVTGIIPVMESLLTKGLPIGTTLALCMSTVAISLPEILMLKQVMRWKLLALFIALILVIFSLVGWFFNAFNFGII